MLDDELSCLRRGALRSPSAWCAGSSPRDAPCGEVNVGGAWGRRCTKANGRSTLDAYAGLLARHFGELGVTVGVEPGEFLTNEAGLLLAEVVTVERRLGTTFVGLDCGWNVMNDHLIYGTRARVRRL